ncbi:MAG: sulfatase-like hydrolase/transferase [Actinobacteria bacterium]|nr:sulfatase-like hydrolase/transferase [Actinomycetota bacterium]
MKIKYNIHPFLFAIFPILSFYGRNKDIADSSSLPLPIIISLAATAILFAALKIIGKNSNRAAASASFFVVLFFASGHYLNYTAPSITIMSFWLLLSFWLIIYIAASALILKSDKNFNSVSAYLNTVAIILIILPLANIGLYEYREKNITDDIYKVDINAVNARENLPDIYYIILDGYARADVLKDIYGYDNSYFINYLKNKGFFVAEESRANYPQTFLSMSSALNFEYINYLSETMGEESDDRRPFKKMIKDNNVYKFLKNNGYKFAVLPSTWTGLHKNLNADIKIDGTAGFNSFDKILLDTTPISFLFRKKIGAMFFRDKILFSFNNMSKVAEISGPTFIYTHFLMPHPPFVFNKDGNPYKQRGFAQGLDGDHYFKHSPDKNEYREKYKNALIFANKKTMEMIDEIISKSDKPPIIILQSDHGPGSMTYWEDPKKTNMKERLSILNAYYLPEEAKQNLYNSITPVNSFRVVLNYIFNADFELLEDKSYFATWSHPYKFIDVTKELR